MDRVDDGSMSTLDYIAEKVLLAMLSAGPGYGTDFVLNAKHAYEQAEAMIAEREEKNRW